MKQNTIMQQLRSVKVEWKTLEEVAVIKTGQTVSKQKISDNQGIYPVINSGREPLGYIDEWNTENDPIGITTRGAGVGSITWQEGKYFRGNLNYSVTIKEPNKLDVRFLFHLLLHFQNELHSLCTFTGIPALNASELKKLRLPIPDINIQKNIVKTLDKLAELEATLEAENTLRIKQYHYYRNLLLTFDDNHPFVGAEFISAQTSPDIQQRADIKSAPTVVWKKLGEVAKKISSGGTPLSTRSEYYNGDIPWLRTQEVKFSDISDTEIKITQAGLDNSSAKWIPENCVIIAISGATAGRSAINKIPLTTNQHCCNIEVDPEIAYYRYVFYWVSKEYENLKALGQGARADLNAGIIKNYLIPIPDLKTQQKIVEILDKFDRLTNSITEGLPKEIELRRKQYEYYREKLLSFK